MKQILKSIIILSLVFFLTDCEKENAKNSTLPSSEERTAKLNKSKEELLKNREIPFNLKGFPSKESAIKEFLLELFPENGNKSSLPTKSILSLKEKRDHLFPQIYGAGTALDSTPLDEYMEMIKQLEAVGIEKLKPYQLTKKEILSLKVKWREEKDYGTLKIHKVGFIAIQRGKGNLELTEIKSIVQIGSKYIVGIVAP